ncbi:hypothetical protein [Kitasatospora purpeofusca]|uniref:hypothetical protein n=1 Tax=Kitasatospora purpeofusca TaxID=67352 RepID=UPI002A5AE07B|nr:hypothetical protein [Kitasatospora purpeofusca]MDY0816236.1 hypothetical protein [Kitasatospora purpeofusca]
MPLILGSLAAAVPLLARDCTDFRPACLVFGCGLLALPVFSILFGPFTLTLVPAGIVLLIAASYTRPEPGRLPLLIGTLVSAATLGYAGWTIGIPWIAPYFQEPDAFVATVQMDTPLPGIGYDGSGLGHGATRVFTLASATERRVVVVFDPRAPDADLAVLRRLITDLPGVTDVRLCDPPAGNCR